MSYKRYDIISYTPTTPPPPPPPPFPFPLPFFDDVTLTTLDVIPFHFHPADVLYTTTETRAVTRITPTLSHLKSISDRVSSLEARFDRLLATKEKEKNKPKKDANRKYTWTYEVEGGRKDTWTAEKKGSERKYKWSTEIEGKSDDKRVYTWKAVIGGDADAGEKKVEKKGKKDSKKEKKKSVCAPRVVEIEEEEDDAVDHRAVVLRQAFTKRAGKNKGKKKELSPLDAAVLIQRTFKAYLIRRSKALRALRELAVAKTKLKELRALFHNFSYRHRVSRDAEERQKFSEKIIVLLLTVDSIEGVDIMVRATKRSMVDELEAMLDVVDPQPTGRSLSIRRRTFDMPSGTIQKEIAEGVAQVVQMLEEENTTFEACV